MRQDELDQLEEKITNEIANAIYFITEESLKSDLKDLQPPSSVILAAARAAAQVLIAFERGYTIGE